MLATHENNMTLTGPKMEQERQMLPNVGLTFSDMLPKMSSDTSMSRQNCQCQHPTNPTKPLLYDLIIGKQTLHDIGAVLDFKEKTITIDYILLPMRNINNLQLKPSISRAFKLNSSFAQKPASTRNATKCVVEILNIKYDKADLSSIVKNHCAHLSTSHHNSLLVFLLKFKELFGGTLGDWKLPLVSF
jgi:hypothetical protein